jgi:hypothetical protein
MSKQIGNLYHPTNREPSEIFEGFNYPCLFLGPLWFAVKGMWLWAVGSALLASFTCGFSWVIFPFFANLMFKKHLRSNGWLSEDQANGININQPYQVSQQQGLAYSQNSEIQKQEFVSVNNGPPPLATNTVNVLNIGGSDLYNLINVVLAQHPECKKSWLGDSIPVDKRQKYINKIAPEIPQNGEAVYLLCYFNFGNVGMIITDKTIYFKLLSGFIGAAKKIQFPLNQIKTIGIESTWTHACYGGGAYGPEFTVNKNLIGWMQMVPDEDEKFLINLISEMNRTTANQL